MSHHYGPWARFLAWLMAREGGRYDMFVGSRKQEMFHDLEGRVVEIGPGAGANLRHLPPGIELVGVEPNPFMLQHLLREAAANGRRVALVRAVVEELPFPDASVDAVVSTLVLCSVARVEQGLQEIRRVLRPGGKLLFIEHVAAPEGSWLRRLQRFVRPAWRRLGEGCEPDRTTEDTLRSAGFRELSVERFRVPLPLVSPHIAGKAVR